MRTGWREEVASIFTVATSEASITGDERFAIRAVLLLSNIARGGVINLGKRGIVVIIGAVESSEAMGEVVSLGGVRVLFIDVAVATLAVLAFFFFLWRTRVYISFIRNKLTFNSSAHFWRSNSLSVFLVVSLIALTFAAAIAAALPLSRLSLNLHLSQ
jgi:hypothetical protein